MYIKCSLPVLSCSHFMCYLLHRLEQCLSIVLESHDQLQLGASRFHGWEETKWAVRSASKLNCLRHKHTCTNTWMHSKKTKQNKTCTAVLLFAIMEKCNFAWMHNRTITSAGQFPRHCKCNRASQELGVTESKKWHEEHLLKTLASSGFNRGLNMKRTVYLNEKERLCVLAACMQL